MRKTAADLKDIVSFYERADEKGRLLRRIESEPSLLGVGPHLMAIARKPKGAHLQNRRSAKRTKTG